MHNGLPFVAVLTALCLAGCNESGGVGVTPTTAAATAPPSSFGLPAGAPCSGEIARYETVVKDDLRTGNVEQTVYDQIQRDLAHATASCSAGHGGEAHAIVASSKARHGYRV